MLNRFLSDMLPEYSEQLSGLRCLGKSLAYLKVTSERLRIYGLRRQ